MIHQQMYKAILYICNLHTVIIFFYYSLRPTFKIYYILIPYSLTTPANVTVHTGW